MEPFTQSAINALKNEAVKVQDYEFASRVRDLEKNNSGLSDKDQTKKLWEMLHEFDKKHVMKKTNRIGETMVVDSEIAKTVTTLIDEGSALRIEACEILKRADAFKKAGIEILRKQYPDFCSKDVGYSFDTETKTITIIQDKGGSNE